MIFVCPHFEGMEEEMLKFSRLYAFPGRPGVPPADGFVILDSGAWALALRGEAMGLGWMRKLAGHYEHYCDEVGYHCIAPDVFLNPYQTQWNWEWWQENVGLRVVPVIQFPKRRRLDVFSAVRQAQFYARWQPGFVAISNPGLLAMEGEGIAAVCAAVRAVMGEVWLHNLGAGWSSEDVRGWRELGCFDSVDSVAYYTDAQAGWSWRRDGKRERCERPWRELAVENARVAVKIARGE